jgi:predicted TIM-barrel fold metal-dependent hydrolase
MNNNIDIVDTQIHIGPGGIDETLAAMNALGIQSVLIDEYWLKDFFAYDPHHTLDNGEIRPVCPTAELAAHMYPDRFSWILRINRNDPDFSNIIQGVKVSPYGRGIRIIPGMNPREIQAFACGEYDHILQAVSDTQLPLFLYLPDQPGMISSCIEKFPDLQIVIDHCGLYNNIMRQNLSNSIGFSKEQQLEMFDKIMQLAKYPNIYLKWAHYSTMFEVPAFPGEKLAPILRKAIEHFGSNRIIWASDFSVNQSGENWSELLYSLKNNIDLSEEELKAILGGNARRLLKWNDRI